MARKVWKYHPQHADILLKISKLVDDWGPENLERLIKDIERILRKKEGAHAKEACGKLEEGDSVSLLDGSAQLPDSVVGKVMAVKRKTVLVDFGAPHGIWKLAGHEVKKVV